MSEVIYKRCPTCGAVMERDDTAVYTSIPPQYRYVCPECGWMEFDTNPPSSPQVINDLTCMGTPIPDEWELFRRDAAKIAMLGLLAGRKSHPDMEYICGASVKYANELIKRLKEDGICQDQSDQ